MLGKPGPRCHILKFGVPEKFSMDGRARLRRVISDEESINIPHPNFMSRTT